MSIQIIVSNDMWNEKTHVPKVSAYDDINLYVLFDQPVSHELEYVENDVTNFWLTLKTQGAEISTLKANKVLNELMSEAKSFKNGKFKFPVCSMPNALSQSYHALFAQKMAGKPAGKYEIEATFHTDNPVQKGKTLASVTFTFDLEEGAKAHLLKTASENLANGADKQDDPAAKAAAFDRINQPSQKFDNVELTLVNKAGTDIWVMLGYNSGKKHLVTYQKSITLTVPAGTELYKFSGSECTTNYGTVGRTKAKQSFDVY